jgi:catechol 2,3-dioxygenase-like lactoylglutathione lyase family enzyme
MATVSVRYIVSDVDAAIDFYCRHLGFLEEMHPAPAFAALSRGGGGGQAMPDGTMPEPGGWNRISLEVTGLPAVIEALRESGVHFRNDLVVGFGGDQILLDDPSGNPVELFEPHPQ